MSIVSNHFPEVLDALNANDDGCDHRGRPVIRKPRQPRPKPRPKPARSIRLLVRPDERGRCAVVAITVGTLASEYIVDRVAADWGQGFAVANIDNGEHYHVNLDGDNRTCDCKGHLRHGHCKHADGIAALIAAGKL